MWWKVLKNDQRGLAKRLWNKGIVGSDVATICGLNKYKSPLQLWLEKTGQVDTVEAGEAASLGKCDGTNNKKWIYNKNWP